MLDKIYIRIKKRVKNKDVIKGFVEKVNKQNRIIKKSIEKVNK